MTEKKSTLLDKAYTSFIDLMLSSEGQIDHLGRVATNDVMGYGTTMDEKIHDLKGLKDLAKLQRKQSADMNFQYKLMPVFRKMMNQDSTAIIVDEIQITMHVNEEKIELQMRLSTILDFIEGNWKVVHWHGSKPEYDSGGSDTWHKEEWNKKNEELQKLVNEKTTDLEKKNRELEIEAALERLRAVAMSLQKAEDLLEVIEVLYIELKSLGFKDIRNTIINIFNDTEEYFLNYDYSDYGVGGINKVDYNSHPSNIELVIKMREASNEFMITEFTGHELDEWRKWRIDQGQMPDAKLDQAESLFYYEYSIGVGTIGISTFSSINADQLKILNKIRNVFDLAYRRYADIEQAEAHEKEAKIEASLERVRSIAMGMQKPDDILDVCKVISDQLEKLNISDIRNIQVAIIDESKKNYLNYQYFSPYSEKVFEVTEYENNPESQAMIREMQKSANSFYTGIIKGKALREFIAWRKKYDQYPDPVMDKSPAVFYYFYSIGNGGLGLTTYKSIDDGELDIFKRFHKVFELAYSRFHDIEKAEAQAREAQIEAALERVRSRSLAMHKSEELAELSLELIKQVQALGVATWFCAFNIYDEDPEGSLEWGSNGQGTFPKYRTPREGIFLHYYEAGQKGETLLINEIDEKECPPHYEYLCSLPGVGEQLLKMKNSGIPFPTSQIDHAAFFKYGYILFITFEPVPEAHDIFKRFAKVFEQTYTRFLDLQKAEEQAREAQIETALERVRSRSMAMHNSEELSETATVMFKQLCSLGQVPDRIGIVVYKEQQQIFENWITDQSGMQLTKAFISSIEEPTTFAKIYKGLKEKKDSIVIDLAGEELKSWIQFIKGNMKMFINESNIKNRRIHYVAFFSHGSLMCTFHEPVSDNFIQLLVRFAKVFDQTYTRFLDLQKAESQAREIQIELSLERVRAMVANMQNSEELLSIMVKMRTEFVSLGHEAHYFWHMKWEDDKYLKAMTSGDGTEIGTLMELPRKIHGEIPLLAAWEKSNKPTVVYVMDVPATLDYVHKMVAWGDFKRVDPNMPTEEDIHHIGGLTYVMARTLHGEIGYSLPGMVPNPPEEAKATFVRFAGVFDLAYRRFEDLQSAEQQNRETQIELALERVRAKTMAMHQTSELQDVINVVHQQFSNLNMHITGGAFIAINEEINKEISCWGAGGTANYIQRVHIPYLNRPIYTEIIKGINKGPGFFSEDYTQEDKIEFFKHLFKHPPYNKTPAAQKKEVFGREGGYARSCIVSKYTTIFIINHHGRKFSDEENEILKRIGKVFEQTYTRFLDLLKAEASTREARIEASLERIRSKALGMQKSTEVGDMNDLLFEEFEKMGIRMVGCGISVINEETDHCEQWRARQVGIVDSFEPFSYKRSNQILKKNVPEMHAQFMKAWKKGDPYYKMDLRGIQRNLYLKSVAELFNYNKSKQKKLLISLPESFFTYYIYYKKGWLSLSTIEALTDDEKSFSRRFVEAFDFAHTRFLDLKQAEDQAHEAQIEAALEKVRARAMSMQRPEELKDVAVLLRKEMGLLGVEELETSSIYLVDKENTECWYAIKDVRKKNTKLVSDHMIIQLQETQVGKEMEKFYISKQKQKSIIMKGENRMEWINYCASQSSVLKSYYGKEIPERTYHLVKFTGGFMGAASPGAISNESWDLLKKSAKVFSLAYTRFRDLQQAVERARETQIELALERVRAKTMAMHNSQDVGATVITLFGEVLNLGIDKSIRLGIGILAGYERMETWSANSNTKGETVLKMGMLDMTIHPMLVGLKKAWKGGKKNYRYDYIGEDVFRYYEALNKEPDYPFQADLNALPENEYHRSFFHPEGILFSFAPEPITEETAMVLERFAHVFGQTYRRYRDLLKAEAQAREAQIEAALERIRSQAMAMQHSNDLNVSTAILFDELEKLELPLERCGIGIFDKETRDCQLYTTVVNDEGKTELATGITSLTVHPMLIKTFDAWEVQESLLYTLEGKELKDYYKLVSKSKFRLPEDVINKSVSLDKEYYYYTPFGAGGLYVFSDIEPTDEEIKVIRRFAEVFHLTYTRYEDLQKAEARALEAVKQASLDRVRGEIASMRSTEDLQRITPLIWSELEILDVPFIRCGVFIIDESNSNIQVHLTTPDGKPIGALNLPIDSNELAKNAVEHWRKNKVYTIRWNKEDFISWMQSMISLGQVQTAEQYQGYSKPPESLNLHFIPFKQGMLYVGNIELLLPEKIELVDTLAKAFSIAYSRYEDFVNLEEAKNRVENTLSELKSAQSQLIHSEKMASLGELTAGIAHEIQNPLNFVNNFSEVSVDLIDEMDEEMAAGNTEEVTAIAEDLKQNLEKITSHGKRASFIVKGMLEHSRTNAGEKTPTDINELADEFLRLSYHGLRAKDKSFNAEFITEFDEDLPKINIISQDFGRVLLNLINNAFYACSERSQSSDSEASAKEDPIYKPTVTLSTKKLDNKVEIIVKDNGNGIPEDIKDKIFQPFFTTKPTGEGTGLGLSLSYDIITKGHSGDLRLHSKEGDGTEFIIDLPIN